MTQYVLAYDISDPRRLQKAHAFLSSVALPIQYSVFLLDGNERQCQECVEALKKIIDLKTDDLRIYALPVSGLRFCLGKGFLPDGLFYSGSL
ncbi:CRISPR-associated endonuclease Cas2 [Duodenibacillus massiliensis]|uniref:CRISPR-associated endonuclease Cas2 n=1 Tax=Duodenibacillus massiliensis TaxID=1852381 RepID=UPI00307C6606